MAEMLNANFVAKVEEIMKQNNYPHIAQSKIEHCPRSLFMLPITENEVECVIKNSHTDRGVNSWQQSLPCCHPLMRSSLENVHSSLYLSLHYRYLIELYVWDSMSHAIKQSSTNLVLMQKKIISFSHSHNFNSLYTTHFITFTEIISRK